MALYYAPEPGDNEAALARLYSVRESIDNIDAALIHLLAERFKFTKFVGTLKAEHGLPPADPARERVQIQRLRTLAAESHLDPEFAEKWFNFVVAEVIHHHVEAAEAVGERDETSQEDGAARRDQETRPRERILESWRAA